MNGSQAEMTAIVLAGQRDGEDELAQYAGVACKALAGIDGKPMLLRVLETLLSSSGVATIILSGPGKEQLQQQHGIDALLRSGDVSWLPPRESPSSSAYAAMRGLQPQQQVLLTTADHPLLTPHIVNEFCRLSLQQDADVVVGFAPYSLVQEQFPAMKKTVLRFRQRELCGCNLFAFLTPQGRDAADFWRQLESRRKKPLQVIRFLGWLTVLRYALGRLSLDDALDALSRKLGLRVRAVMLPHADAAVDVDSVADYELVQERFAWRKENAS